MQQNNKFHKVCVQMIERLFLSRES